MTHILLGSSLGPTRYSLNLAIGAKVLFTTQYKSCQRFQEYISSGEFVVFSHINIDDFFHFTLQPKLSSQSLV